MDRSSSVGDYYWIFAVVTKTQQNSLWTRDISIFHITLSKDLVETTFRSLYSLETATTTAIPLTTEVKQSSSFPIFIGIGAGVLLLIGAVVIVKRRKPKRNDDFENTNHSQPAGPEEVILVVDEPIVDNLPDNVLHDSVDIDHSAVPAATDRLKDILNEPRMSLTRSDEEKLKVIEVDFGTSDFTGEGHQLTPHLIK